METYLEKLVNDTLINMVFFPISLKPAHLIEALLIVLCVDC